MDSLHYGSEGEKREWKKLQDKFSHVTGLFLCCLDGNGSLMAEPSGEKEDWDFLLEAIGKPRFDSLYQELRESRVEDMVIEKADVPGVWLAALALRNEGKAVFVWLAVGLEENAGLTMPSGHSDSMTEQELYRSLDLLMELSARLMRAEALRRKAEAESMRSRFSEKEMSESLRRVSATTEIVQYLECEEAVEKVLYDIMKTAGTFLELDSAQVFQVHGNKMDVLAEWLAEGRVSLFDRNRNVEKMSLFTGTKPLVISEDTHVSGEEQAILDRFHVKASMIFPILINGKESSMYVCFNQCKRERAWTVWDVRFASNAARVMMSILVRRVQKNSLTSSYAVLESVLDNAGSAIFVRDEGKGQILFANKVLKRIFARELEEGSFDRLMESAPEGRRTDSSYEIKFPGKEDWYDVCRTQINWVDGRLVVLYALYDITDKKVYQQKIEQQAYTDFLTGLYNRMCCERDLAWQIDESHKKGGNGALLYLDLDDFKHINDGLGHQYGDALLKAISHSLRRIEGINNTCYRMGGDEFVIIIPPENYQRFESIIEEIKSVFNKPWFLKGADYYCTMSMGVVTFPEEGQNVQELIRKADIAMYEAKKRGKNRLAKYSEKLKSFSGKRLDMEKNMREATVNNYEEFEIHYQPIIDIRGETPVCRGAEALIRWNNSELGYIPPSEFIPLAEYLGLINPIGNHVLTEACKVCKRWNDMGHSDYKINVNLSVVQLLQTDIVEIVERAMKVSGIQPQNLTLEVTESLAINDMNRMKGILKRIRALGVRIALDDFGTGYSSLNHIREIPLDVIKIDQSFVRDLSKGAYSQAFIRMVAELAEAIGVNVCVEGIETKAQYEALADVQISMIQGYYFDKPMPEAKFEDKYVKQSGAVKAK